MSQLTQLTQQNAAGSEELAATAEEMTGQAEKLRSLMSFFETGAGDAAPSASPVASAGPTFQIAIRSGKFQGTIWPTTRNSPTTPGATRGARKFMR